MVIAVTYADEDCMVACRLLIRCLIFNENRKNSPTEFSRSVVGRSF